jgi:tetrahydromethanopterin S-methyltransferase subunit E
MEVALIFLGIISIVIGVICIRIGITYNRMLDGIADYIELSKEDKKKE